MIFKSIKNMASRIDNLEKSISSINEQYCMFRKYANYKFEYGQERRITGNNAFILPAYYLTYEYADSVEQKVVSANIPGYVDSVEMEYATVPGKYSDEIFIREKEKSKIQKYIYNKGSGVLVQTDHAFKDNLKWNPVVFN